MLWILGAIVAAAIVAAVLSADWDGAPSPTKVLGRLGTGLGVAVLVALRLGAGLAEIAGLVFAVLKVANVAPVASYGWGNIAMLIVAPAILWLVLVAIVD